MLASIRNVTNFFQKLFKYLAKDNIHSKWVLADHFQIWFSQTFFWTFRKQTRANNSEGRELPEYSNQKSGYLIICEEIAFLYDTVIQFDIGWQGFCWIVIENCKHNWSDASMSVADSTSGPSSNKWTLILTNLCRASEKDRFRAFLYLISCTQTAFRGSGVLQ